MVKPDRSFPDAERQLFAFGFGQLVKICRVTQTKEAVIRFSAKRETSGPFSACVCWIIVPSPPRACWQQTCHRSVKLRHFGKGRQVPSNDRPLDSRVAWVTGSSRGLGKVMAEELCRLGARVAVHGTRPDSPKTFDEGGTMEELAAEIAGFDKR